ncbi:unnamed protein product [Lupinus luteus]|uniref:Protein E6 n=1 Tax=Lupinus luteus TaxID=3873 RepID=A0AAV1VVL7_LUPLU
MSSMAPFSIYISFFFLATLLFPLQIIARESHFFSKIPHSNNNVKETELPKKEEPENKPEEQPVFIPETENSYGLYGHESTQNPSTGSSYEPYETEFQHTSKNPNKYHHSYNNNDAFNTNQNEELSNTKLSDNYRNNYYNKDAYDGNQNELSDTKHTEGEYNSMGNQHDYKKHYYNNNNAANNNMYNGEKQGMSDTRFLDGGKYFYDLNYEKYNPTIYGDSSRGVNTHNKWYNNRGNNYYGNNNGYQTQEEFEDEQVFEP